MIRQASSITIACHVTSRASEPGYPLCARERWKVQRREFGLPGYPLRALDVAQTDRPACPHCCRADPAGLSLASLVVVAVNCNKAPASVRVRFGFCSVLFAGLLWQPTRYLLAAGWPGEQTALSGAGQRCVGSDNAKMHGWFNASPLSPLLAARAGVLSQKNRQLVSRPVLPVSLLWLPAHAVLAAQSIGVCRQLRLEVRPTSSATSTSTSTSTFTADFTVSHTTTAHRFHPAGSRPFDTV